MCFTRNIFIDIIVTILTNDNEKWKYKEDHK